MKGSLEVLRSSSRKPGRLAEENSGVLQSRTHGSFGAPQILASSKEGCHGRSGDPRLHIRTPFTPYGQFSHTFCYGLVASVQLKLYHVIKQHRPSRWR